jgi:hypothetical protein
MPIRPPRLPRCRLVWVMLLGILTIGCDSDQRVAELSRESLKRQAEQNQEMARQNQAVTETTQQLIQSESGIQHDASQLHLQLHTERSNLDQQRQNLEGERRDLAAERRRDSIIAQAIPGVVTLVAAALPLVVCWYLARSIFLTGTQETGGSDILIEQLATQGPLLAACTNANRLEDALPTKLLPAEIPRLLTHAESDTPVKRPSTLRAVVVIEGVHDAEFLKRISHTLSRADSGVPDLGRLETAGLIAFIVNNGTSIAFPAGLAPKGLSEFHLLDQEAGLTSVQRKAAVAAINTRSNCRAALTAKRAIENYLHPEAIREAGVIEITFGDFDDVAEFAAKATFNREGRRSWESLSRRARRRLRDKAKKWLNREAVDRMTPVRLAERDPAGEVIGWLQSIANLAVDPVEASA